MVAAAPEVPVLVVAELVAAAAAAAAASGAAVKDTWAAAGTRVAGIRRGRTHIGGSRSSKASVPDPSSSAGTRTAAHTQTPDSAAATPPSLSTEYVERAKRLKNGKARAEAATESSVQNA